MIPKFVAMRLLVFMGPLLLAGVSHTALAAGVTVGFNTISGSTDTAFGPYTESGVTVSPISGTWLVSKAFGDPTPYIYFNAPAGSTITGSIAISDGGSVFSFSSIDLYSSTTTIPYTFTGLLNNQIAFSVSGTVPNTYGNFALIMNPDSSVDIDKLEVTLADPSAPCCSNPVGLDNITIVPIAANVPEPKAASLLIVGLVISFAWLKIRGQFRANGQPSATSVSP